MQFIKTRKKYFQFSLCSKWAPVEETIKGCERFKEG